MGRKAGNQKQGLDVALNLIYEQESINRIRPVTPFLSLKMTQHLWLCSHFLSRADESMWLTARMRESTSTSQVHTIQICSVYITTLRKQHSLLPYLLFLLLQT